MKKQTVTFFLFVLSFAVHFSLVAQDPFRFRDEVAALTKIDFSADSAQNTILFTGSSSMRLWKDCQSYFPERKIINTGFGGSHMSDLLFYADSLIFRFTPAQIFIYEGDNDIADNENPDSILAEAKLLAKKIKDRLPNTEIIFISPKPSISRWHLRNEYERFNLLLEQLASETGHVRFLNVWPVMLDSSMNLKKELFLEDGLHMNKSGYVLWAGEIRKFIR